MPIDPTNPIVAQQTALTQQLNAPRKPNTPDPFPIYKAGEPVRSCHAIDFPNWEAHGWSKDPVETPADSDEETELDQEQNQETETPAPVKVQRKKS